MGEAYLSAEGANRNVGKAIESFAKAAKAGYGPAAYNLGNLYYLGRDGVVRDLNQAYTYFSMAAEVGHADALLAIGRMYALGEREHADGSNAEPSYKESAEQRNSKPTVAVTTGRADAVQGNPGIALTVPELAKPSLATQPGPMASAAADDTVDMVNDTLNLALSSLASNASDAEALHNLRRATDALNIATNPAADSQSQAGEVMFAVHVTGLRAVPWKSYGAMRAAVSAYEKYKSLAPDAVFRFAVMPPEGMKLPPNFALRVRTKTGQEFPIRLEHRELFTLPPLPDLKEEADLVSNFKGGVLRIGILLHTRTVSPEKLRLGDIRLRYEINTVIAMFDDPWEYDSQCKDTGRWSRCKRPSKVIWHQPWTATNGALIVEGSRRTPLQDNGNPNHHMYQMPIAGQQWSNDAIIEFDYKAPLLRPRKLFEAAIYNGNN